MAATIYEVAALAGVSPATVSRVLNGGRVSEAYAQRVREAVDTLQFRPNRTARNLRRQRSEIIALIIPDIENPFFTALARGVEDQALRAGYSVVLCNTDEHPEKEARYLEMALSGHLAGVVLAPASAATRLDALVESRLPVVTVDRPAHGPEVDAVVMDDVAAARRATTALYDQGYGRVGCITGPRDVDTATARATGWREVFLDRSAGGDPAEYVRFADYRVAGGRAAMLELLRLPAPPDAVFVANNLMSLGALQQLVEADLRPPAVGLASLGELPFLPPGTPGITVEPWPARELGTAAAALLLERIDGAEGPARTVVIRAAGDEPVQPQA
jgi:LacI family transcriptional regulator